MAMTGILRNSGVIAAMVIATPASAQQVEGYWEGALAIGGTELAIGALRASEEDRGTS